MSNNIENHNESKNSYKSKRYLSSIVKTTDFKKESYMYQLVYSQKEYYDLIEETMLARMKI
jgi:hypothetical protein